mmetsp:Transcript_15294/g.43737  ORF Transcript_15294/g.43737 Transcript_15294/m.43737 type:complete len:211 (-) Transcript_15294:134-766(-)
MRASTCLVRFCREEHLHRWSRTVVGDQRTAARPFGAHGAHNPSPCCRPRGASDDTFEPRCSRSVRGRAEHRISWLRPGAAAPQRRPRPRERCEHRVFGERQIRLRCGGGVPPNGPRAGGPAALHRPGPGRRAGPLGRRAGKARVRLPPDSWPQGARRGRPGEAEERCAGDGPPLRGGPARLKACQVASATVLVCLRGVAELRLRREDDWR